jgi:hypothetical protein
MKFLSLYILSSIFLFSCTKKDPFISKSAYDALVQSESSTIQNVSFIFNENIYFLSNFEGTPEQITNDASGSKSNLKMSYDHQKFAYQNISGYIEIVSRSGRLLEQLVQYSDVKSFNWSTDNKTLYILNNNELVFFGEPMDVPTLDIPSEIPSNFKKDIVALSISVFGDLAYIVKTDNQNFTYGYMMVTKPNDGSNSKLIYHQGQYNQGESSNLNYIQFSSHNQDLVLGYEDYYDKRMDLFKNLYQTPEYTYRSSAEYRNSIYRSDLNYLLTCYQASSSTDFIIKADALNYSDDDIILSEYSSSSTSLYLDWK